MHERARSPISAACAHTQSIAVCNCYHGLLLRLWYSTILLIWHRRQHLQQCSQRVMSYHSSQVWRLAHHLCIIHIRVGLVRCKQSIESPQIVIFLLLAGNCSRVLLGGTSMTASSRPHSSSERAPTKRRRRPSSASKASTKGEPVLLWLPLRASPGAFTAAGLLWPFLL
jgi:hypothetical protein